ncbi:MAG TPA: hypothetical protein PKO10_01065 [Aliarcobacter cryaerophilus]|nr:hypothetical protein [Aliarcobacter cryaerophilus]
MNNQVFEEMKSIAKDYNIVFSDENDIKICKKIKWDCISKYQKLSEEFIREFADKVDWYNVSAYQKLSESFIREFANKVYWRDISYKQKLSEEFIREFSDKVDWYWISFYQKLSEEFIREFADRIDWHHISMYQKLSEEFIREFADKVDWNNISRYQKLSESFIKEYKLTISKYNWLYKTKEDKLSYLKENCNSIYEIVDDDYIVAYKSTLLNGYSTYNFQYQYKVNGIYESHCDCNINNENSFGLSAWTKEKALKHYNKGKLFKVHINIEDIGAIVCNNKKIRCSKLTIVSEESFK